jgi:methionyl-tRNA formyltransferase
LKIVILTSSRYGTAANHLPVLINSKMCEIVMVILNDGIVTNQTKGYQRIFRKIKKIGILGALNGIRMRKWFNEDMSIFKKFKDIELICREKKIPFYITPYINSTRTMELFKKSNCDLGISLGNGYISKGIFSIPRFGMINIHHEILPDYQNAQSVIWQIYNMSSCTGFTIHKIDKHIDTGEILYQEIVPIHFEKLVKVISDFDNLNKNAKPQGSGRSYTTPSIWQYIKIENNFKKLRLKGS